jgi:hypothetical protein
MGDTCNRCEKARKLFPASFHVGHEDDGGMKVRTLDLCGPCLAVITGRLASRFPASTQAAIVEDILDARLIMAGIEVQSVRLKVIDLVED